MARYLGISRRRWIFWRQHLWEVPWFTRDCSPMSGKWPVRACWLYHEPTLDDRLEALERQAATMKAASSRLQRVFEDLDRLQVTAAADDRPHRLGAATQQPRGPAPPKK